MAFDPAHSVASVVKPPKSIDFGYTFLFGYFSEVFCFEQYSQANLTFDEMFWSETRLPYLAPDAEGTRYCRIVQKSCTFTNWISVRQTSVIKPTKSGKQTICKNQLNFEDGSVSEVRKSWSVIERYWISGTCIRLVDYLRQNDFRTLHLDSIDSSTDEGYKPLGFWIEFYSEEPEDFEYWDSKFQRDAKLTLLTESPQWPSTS